MEILHKLGILILIILGIILLSILLVLIYSLFVYIKDSITKIKTFVINYSYFSKEANTERILEKYSIIIFEAKINQLTRYGNPEYFRSGTYHYFPHQLVYLSGSHQSKSNSTRVVGLHRTGKIYSFQIRDVDLSYVNIKLIEYPSDTLFEWLNKYNVAYIYNSKNGLNIVKKLLINNKQYGKILFPQIPFDNEIRRAKLILTEFKGYLLNNDIVKIIAHFIKFPIKIYYSTEIIQINDHIKSERGFKLIDEDSFDVLIPEIFSKKVIEKVLSINPEFLCPKNRFMFVSIFKIGFSNSKWHIRSIDLSADYENKEFRIPM